MQAGVCSAWHVCASLAGERWPPRAGGAGGGLCLHPLLRDVPVYLLAAGGLQAGGRCRPLGGAHLGHAGAPGGLCLRGAPLQWSRPCWRHPPPSASSRSELLPFPQAAACTTACCLCLRSPPGGRMLGHVHLALQPAMLPFNLALHHLCSWARPLASPWRRPTWWTCGARCGPAWWAPGPAARSLW